MKATLIALLSIAMAVAGTAAKASTIAYVYIAPPSTDSRQCNYYTDNFGQWWAISKADDNASDQIALLVAAKANSWQVDIYYVGSACGTPAANAYVH